MSRDEWNQARAVFEKQLDCLLRDDRDAQMELYAPDLRCEFPFAVDRPRVIDGRDAFRDVMTPMWKEARQRGWKVLGHEYEFHATDEPGLYVARFTLDVALGDGRSSLPFVQFLRIEGGLITEVKEYFNPAARAGLRDTPASSA